MNEEELTAVFERLGARDPQSWARSQMTEGIPQLARFLFLRCAWSRVVADDDHSWIEANLRVSPNRPGGAIPGALKRMLEMGVSKEDLTTIVRVMQWQLLHSLCYLMDDPNDPEADALDIAWGLFQIDDQGNPATEIGGLHESVLETDPSGREMTPPT